MRRPLPILAAACAAAVLLAPPAAAAATHDWTRFGFDAARSNSSAAKAGIRGGDLHKLKRQDVTVPGTVDASLVYLHHVKVAGKTRDVFFATTSYGRVFALDARTGQRLWTYTPPTYDALRGGPQITQSTPIVDRTARAIYSVSPDGKVRRLGIAHGHEVTSHSWPARLTLDPTHEKLGTPLNFSGRYVVATTGGYTGDAQPYQGRVGLIDRKTGKVSHVFNSLCSNRRNVFEPATCSSSDSAIWGRGGAVVVPGTHHILVATGNGPFDGKTDWGDSVLELSSDAKRLVGNWTPTNEADLSNGDVDLGSAAPALLKNGRHWLALQGGKDAKLRLLRVGNLNGHGRACNCKGNQLQTLTAPNGSAVFSAPASWRHRHHSWAFVAGLAGGTGAYRLSGGKLHKVWQNDNAGTSPVIAGGLLYVYRPGGGVNVYRPATGKLVGTLDSDGGHWNTPIVADGRVAIPTGDANSHDTSGRVTIYRKP